MGGKATQTDPHGMAHDALLRLGGWHPRQWRRGKAAHRCRHRAKDGRTLSGRVVQPSQVKSAESDLDRPRAHVN